LLYSAPAQGVWADRRLKHIKTIKKGSRMKFENRH